MRIWLNQEPMILVPGMTVRQALIQAGLFKQVTHGARVFDEWGNEMGLDGALEEGMRIILKTPKENPSPPPFAKGRR